METGFLLLRGVNVGGHHKLPMKDLVALLEGLGCRDVRTYIQSGNAVERKLGVPVTARNWNTVSRLWALADESNGNG